MYVIADLQLAVAVKPGSYVKQPVSLGSLAMSMHGAPSVGCCTGRTTFLSPAARVAWVRPDLGSDTEHSSCLRATARGRRTEGDRESARKTNRDRQISHTGLQSIPRRIVTGRHRTRPGPGARMGCAICATCDSKARGTRPRLRPSRGSADRSTRNEKRLPGGSRSRDAGPAY